MQKRCVYTCLVGNYEDLNEQLAAVDADIDFICFTDNPNLQSTTWQVRLIKPVFSYDPIRSQRYMKIMSHYFVGQYHQSLYIDNSVILKRSPALLFEQLTNSNEPLILPHHSFRDKVLDEFIEVSRSGFDDQARVFEQLNHYLMDSPEVLDEKPLWTAILVRNHNDEKLKSFSQLWLNHVMRYSRRDQLSINMALAHSGLHPLILPLDAFESEHHIWPCTKNRNREAGTRKTSTSFMPPLAKLRELELTNDSLTAELNTYRPDPISSTNRAMGSYELSEQLRLLRTKVAEQKQQLATQKFRLEQQRLDNTEMSQSKSWRLTRPFRKLAAKFQKSSQQAPDKDSKTALIIKCSNSRLIYANPNDRRAKDLASKKGVLNPNSLFMWQQLLAERTWNIIADVGANYGEMLVNCEIPASAKVFAFEPNANVMPFLKKTLRAASISAEVVGKALSNQEGSASFYVDHTWSGTSSLEEATSTSQINSISTQRVAVTTLDRVLASTPLLKEKCLLVKLDVEGHEMDVLRGAEKTLAHINHFAIMIEALHLTEMQLEKIMSQFSIRVFNLTKGRLELINASCAQDLRILLDNKNYYDQDVVLERRNKK